MKYNILKRAFPAIAGLSLLAGAVACNQKVEDNEVEGYEVDSAVAVSAFKLKPKPKVLNNLDSVFFSIDLKNGVIYNADSLPVGTDVTSLVPVITYSSTVTSAVIDMEGGSKRQGQVDYKENPTDSIDFSGNVFLTLQAENGAVSRKYRIKVNVHKFAPDSLMWDDMAKTKLPSRLSDPANQATVKRGESVYSMIRESDGSLSMAVSSSPASASWEVSQVVTSEQFDIRTFTAADDAFYILDTEGRLFTSSDAKAWSATGEKWFGITGGYGNCVIGVASGDTGLKHVYYPAKYKETPLEESFPVSGNSNMGIFYNKWSIDPVGLTVGGIDKNGAPVDALWAFDGSAWAKLAENGPCSLRSAMLVPYYSYRSPGSSWRKVEYSVWMIFGGMTPDGQINRTVWLSYDNGVHWQKAVDSMQLPETLPALYDASAVVMSSPMSANLSDAWTRMAGQKKAPWARLAYSQDGYNINWDCPYIYIFGGFDANGDFNRMVFRGVLNRLTFTPLF